MEARSSTSMMRTSVLGADLGGLTPADGDDGGHPVGDVEGDDLEGLTLVEVDGAGVHDAERPPGVDGPHHVAAAVGDAVLLGRRAAQTDPPRRRAPFRPERRASSHLQHVVEHEVPDAVGQVVRPPPLVGGGEGQLVGGAGQVGEQDVAVRRVDDGRLGGAGEELVGMGHEPLVELVAAGHEDGEGGGGAASRPPGLLPHRGDGAGEAVDHAGVEPPDVDAELQRAGGDDAVEAAVEELVLDGTALGGEVAAPVGPHVAAAAESSLGLGCHQLGALAAAAEGDGPVPAGHEAGDQRRRLGVGGGPGAGAFVDERRVPQGEQALAVRRCVIGDRRDVQTAQRRRQGRRLADGRRREDERRVGAQVVAEPPQAPEELGDVAAEHPSEGVQLVHHHVAQAHEERRPPAVVGQQPGVEHVGVGQHHRGVGSREGALLGRGVAVVAARHHARQRQGGERPELVPGERLGGEQHQSGARSTSLPRRRFADHRLVAQRLARCGAGGDGHRAPGAGKVDRRCLVLPQPVHAETAPHRRRQRRGGLGVASRASREPLEVDQAVVRRQRPHDGLELHPTTLPRPRTSVPRRPRCGRVVAGGPSG